MNIAALNIKIWSIKHYTSFIKNDNGIFNNYNIYCFLIAV